MYTTYVDCYLVDHAHALGDDGEDDALEDVHEGLVRLGLLDREGVEDVAARRRHQYAHVGGLVVRRAQPATTVWSTFRWRSVPKRRKYEKYITSQRGLAG